MKRRLTIEDRADEQGLKVQRWSTWYYLFPVSFSTQLKFIQWHRSNGNERRSPDELSLDDVNGREERNLFLPSVLSRFFYRRVLLFDLWKNFSWLPNRFSRIITKNCLVRVSSLLLFFFFRICSLRRKTDQCWHAICIRNGDTTFSTSDPIDLLLHLLRSSWWSNSIAFRALRVFLEQYQSSSTSHPSVLQAMPKRWIYFI